MLSFTYSHYTSLSSGLFYGTFESKGSNNETDLYAQYLTNLACIDLVLLPPRIRYLLSEIHHLHIGFYNIPSKYFTSPLFI